MATLKRATRRLRELGIDHITIERGLYGPYLYDPRLRVSRSVVLKSPDECIQAALRGELPKGDPR